MEPAVCPVSTLAAHPATNWVKSVRSWKNVGSGLGTMEIYDTDNGFEFDFDRGLLEVETVPGAWEQLACPASLHRHSRGTINQ